MATWLDIAKEDATAGNSLYAASHYRAAINRYYYAAFHLLTGELYQVDAQRMFYLGRKTPGHRELPSLVRLHLASLSIRKRNALGDAILRLYRRRETADDTDSDIDEQYCKEALRFLIQVTNLTGAQL